MNDMHISIAVEYLEGKISKNNVKLRRLKHNKAKASAIAEVEKTISDLKYELDNLADPDQQKFVIDTE